MEPGVQTGESSAWFQEKVGLELVSQGSSLPGDMTVRIGATAASNPRKGPSQLTGEPYTCLPAKHSVSVTSPK